MEKAIIYPLDKNDKVVDSKKIEVMFNPKELTISRQNSWTQKESPKLNVPKIDFGGGGMVTLQMQLFFDTWVGKETNKEDVGKKYTRKLYELMDVDDNLKDDKNQKARPPSVRFQWGKNLVFDAVITSLSQRFTLFTGEGTPVRAIVDITFSQAKDPHFYPKQNPTSGGIGGERIRTVRDGDTLSLIAYEEYNNPSQWRRIADANRLTQVRRLTAGTRLLIPNV